MNDFNYLTAVDELHSHLSPPQFHYLLSVLASSPGSSEEESLSRFSSQHSTLISDDETVGSPSVQTTETSSSSSQDSISVEVELPLASARKVRSEWKYPYVANKFKLRGGSPDEGSQFSSQMDDELQPGQLTVLQTSGSARQVAVLRRLKGVNYQPSSLDSTSVSSKRPEGSLQALRGTSLDNSIARNLNYTHTKYAQTTGGKDVTQHLALQRLEHKGYQMGLLASEDRCSNLPACKRTLRKFALGNKVTFSRSSSLETVKAESLPDEFNPYEPVAGKIATEPVNPFPVLKATTTASTRRSKRKVSLLDTHRIEQDVDRVLQKSEDYKDVSKFFSASKSIGRGGNSIPLGKVGTRNNGVYNLSRRVTNPLYKVYNPEGYKKSDDELATECIDMICSDFNKWMNSLEDGDGNRNGEIQGDRQVSTSQCNETSIETKELVPPIGPDFLIRILRKELELPEEEDAE